MNPQNILEKVYQAKEKKIKTYPCHVNRASELGHPCERYLVYARLNWADKKPHEVETQFIFDIGNMIEVLAKDDLEGAGFKLQPQRVFEWREYQITGHLDFILINGVSPNIQQFAVEVKSINQFDWEKVNTVQDLLESSKPWLQKYPAQLYLYMLMSNLPQGFFYLKNKQNGQPKIVPLELNDFGMEYAEGILQKAARINAYIVARTYPEGQGGPACKWCSFFHICLPGNITQGQGLEIGTAELETKLLRRQELAEAWGEYKKLDAEIAEAVKEKELVSVGDFIITGKWVEKKEYTVKAGRYWQKNIEYMKG